MINITYFIKALKVSWMRRILQNSQGASWFTLSEIDFQKVQSFGNGYSKRSIATLYNPFWKELLQIWSYFCNCIRIESVYQILNSPLWFNNNLLNGEYFFIRDWYNKGLRHVSDLIDENGIFYEFEDIKNHYNVRGTFLDFQSLLRKIPNEWRTVLEDNKVTCILNKYNVRCSIYMQQLMADKKGCRRFYDIMTGSNIFIENNKWERKIPGISEREWIHYYSVLNQLNEVKLRDFQFKVTHNILVTKSFLYRINRIDNDRCEYCNQQAETIRHLFVECEPFEVKLFWSLLKDWLIASSNIDINLTERNILFAFQDKHRLRNYIFVLAKHYIYTNKFSGKQLNLDSFKAI